MTTVRFEFGLKPIFKHEGGEGHDQKSHGNWATGGASGISNSELERAYQDFQGFSEETSYSALYLYTHNGYKILNGYQRGGDQYALVMDEKDEFMDKIPSLLIESSGIDSDIARGDGDEAYKEMEKLIETTTVALDTAIDESPQVLEGKISYRVASVDALRGLKEGDIFTEKGYVSTTSVDITKDSKLRENLGQIDKTTDDVVVKIYNGTHGKGLSVNNIQEAAANKNAFENEIILPRGRDFKFIGKDKDGNYLLERQN